MSEVVTDFVKKYVAEYGILPYSTDRPAEPQPTESELTAAEPTAATKPAAATAKRGKVSKGAS
ncbi:hypothetical protein QUB49_33845 [Microcoleus sp. AT9_B4]